MSVMSVSGPRVFWSWSRDRLMRRWWGIVALLASVGLIGGCAVSAESRLDEFRAEGEAISHQIVESIPTEVIAEGPDTDSRGQLAPSMGQTPQTPAWWQVDTFVDLVNEPAASETAATAVESALVDDGWVKAEERGSSDPVYKSDEYRRDGWYVAVGWVRSDPSTVESFSILVVSPDTVRGDHEDVYS